MKIFKRPDGSVSNYPDNIEDAKKLKYKFYLPYNSPRPCGHKSVIYTKSLYCRQCQLMKQDIVFRKTFRPDEVIRYIDCMAVYNTIDGGLICYPEEWEDELNGLAELLRSGGYRLGGDVCATHGHVRLVNNSTSCHLCDLEKEGRHNAARIEARKRGETWYTPDTPCGECGEVAPRRVQDNICSFCSHITPGGKNSSSNVPRIEARKRGETWYTPDTPCGECGEVAPRRVHDDACSHCCNIVPRRVMTNRQKAIDAGMKFYISDKPCPNCGTVGLKRVVNGRCQACSSDNREAELSTSLMMTDLHVSAADGHMVFWDGSEWQLNVDNYFNKGDD